MTVIATSSARAQNPRGSGGLLREEIIDAARQLLAESGDPSQLTLRGIAKRVGIAAPSIYQHFADADHLKLAVVERSFSEFIRQRDSARDPLRDPTERLLAGCRAYCNFALEHPGEYRFMFSHESPLQGRQSPSGAKTLAVLEESIMRCEQAGLMKSTSDAKTLASDTWCALHGIASLRINAPEFDWPDSMPEMVDRVVSRLLGLNGGV
jgi:AcrR family transcriptional regulator